MKCTKCGWENPETFKTSTCHVCGEFLPKQRCWTCKQVLDLDMFYKQLDKRIGTYRVRQPCRTCELIRMTKLGKDLEAAHLQEAQQLFTTWLTRCKNTNSGIMTEEEWKNACSYFKGCAICGDPHIEAREFFIPYQQGGKYAAWNIIPLCGTCYTRYRNDNPFAEFDKYLSMRAYKYGNDKIVDNILNYLRRVVERYEQ